MKYRHRYHAGNFADVHKHVGLLALLADMQRKDKGFLYIDSHGGAGAYELGAGDSGRGAEAERGVTALLRTTTLTAPELTAYCQAVLDWRASMQRSAGYPGSPALAVRALRPQDRALCFEQLPSECRALQRLLGVRRGVRIECSDGYRGLVASLPPRERRSLILLDPPYEDPEREIQQALAAIAAALERLANAVITLWYPLKDERWLRLWQRQLLRQLDVPALNLMLWLYPRDSRVALNGSGLLVINPPYSFQQRAAHWQRQLWQALDSAGQGGQAIHTLREARKPHHAQA